MNAALKNYKCDNQMNIFDLLGNGAEPEIRLNRGDIVYKVILADILTLYVGNINDETFPFTYLYDNGTKRGYTATQMENGKAHGFDTILDDSIGTDVFLSLEEAENKVRKYIEKDIDEFIILNDSVFSERLSFETNYIDSQMLAEVIIVGNNGLYFKNWYEYPILTFYNNEATLLEAKEKALQMIKTKVPPERLVEKQCIFPPKKMYKRMVNGIICYVPYGLAEKHSIKELY